MSHRFDAVLPAPFGKIGVRADGEHVHEIVYLPDSFDLIAPASALARRVAAQLDAYYADPDTVFDLPLAHRGTAFQRKVWDAISAVPRGGLTTYGTIAKSSAAACRARCGAGVRAELVPGGHSLPPRGGRQRAGGFAHHGEEGFHLGVKRWLLRHEGAMLL